MSNSFCVPSRLHLRLRWAALAVAVGLSGCGGEDASAPRGTAVVGTTANTTVRAATPTRLQATAEASATLLSSPLFGDTTGGSTFVDPVNTQTELTAVTVRHGYWIDAVQAHVGSVTLPAHGGSSGITNTFTLAAGEYLVAIHGRTGANAVVPAISQISFVTNKGHVYGPYGQGLGQGQTTPFYWRVPVGGRIVGFTGRAGAFLNAIGVQYVVESSTPDVVASPVVGAPGGTPFTDTVAAGQRITGLWVNHGSWIDAIQARATPTDLPLRGGGGGQQDFIELDEGNLFGNSIVRVRGLIGGSATNPAIAQLSFETAYFSNYTFGPYGLALGQDPLTPFQLDVPVGHRLVGFTGRAGTYLNAIGLLTQREDPLPVLTSPVVGASAGTAFRDEVAAGQWMHGFTVRHGSGVDGIQGFEGGFALPARGGTGGNATTVILDPGEYLIGITTSWSNDTARPAIRNLSLRSNRGRFFGPFGTDPDPTGERFDWDVPYGGRIIGFAGREGEGSYLNAFGVEYVLDMRAPTTADTLVRVADDASGVGVESSILPGEWFGGAEVFAQDWVNFLTPKLCRSSPGCGTDNSTPNRFSLLQAEVLVRMFGLLGGNASQPAIAQISFQSNWGRTFGPYGRALGQDPTTPFDITVPVGTHIVDLPFEYRLYEPSRPSMVALGARYERDFLQVPTSPAFGSPLGFEFHDQVATGQVLTGVRINHGNWIDAIQGLASPHDLARHGGHGGGTSSFALSPGEHLVRIYGLQGANPVAPAIARISFQTSTGRTFGPFGTAVGQEPTTPFDYQVPARGRIVGFSGRAHAYLNAIGVQFVIDPR